MYVYMYVCYYYLFWPMCYVSAVVSKVAEDGWMDGCDVILQRKAD